MRNRSLTKSLAIAAVMFAVILGLTPLIAAPRDSRQSPQVVQVPLIKEVRHDLLMLPFYGVFDNLSFEVKGDNITLMGQVTQPILKSDAQNAISRIEGVGKVTNNIEVLPLSPYDDHLRLALYRRIYSTPGLDVYALRAVPTIHIIVKNGNVTLDGAVGSQMDRNLAGIVANGVPGTFSVTNNLTVD